MDPNFIFIALILLVFYFFIILPQQRKQKAQQKFKEAIQKGDKIVTLGGIHGKIHAIEEDTIVIEVDKGTKLTIEKNAISVEASKRFEVAKTSSDKKEQTTENSG